MDLHLYVIFFLSLEAIESNFVDVMISSFVLCPFKLMNDSH